MWIDNKNNKNWSAMVSIFFPFQLWCSFSLIFQMPFMTETVQAQSIGESKAKDSHRSPLLCGLLCLLPHQLRNYVNMTCVIRPCRPQSTCFRTAVWHWCKSDIWHKASYTEWMNLPVLLGCLGEEYLQMMWSPSAGCLWKAGWKLEHKTITPLKIRNWTCATFATSNCCKIFQNYANCLNAMNWLQFWRCNMAYLPAPFSSFLVLMSPHIQQVCLRQRLTIQKSWIRQSSKYASIGHKMQ